MSPFARPDRKSELSIVARPSLGSPSKLTGAILPVKFAPVVMRADLEGVIRESITGDEFGEAHRSLQISSSFLLV